ncbi:hypothetical protein OUZ56_030379 [Daphnia magna]|uniref:Uncharacterized protein n=1 Tax=Daphnia magna TaxID=35525 RepID=A0ABQ9ZSE5_9CRUS|nr:hypothetical protein OUZ56_030379 [Daphnia magna]
MERRRQTDSAKGRGWSNVHDAGEPQSLSGHDAVLRWPPIRSHWIPTSDADQHTKGLLVGFQAQSRALTMH